jgi:hypothetical protein
MEAIDEIIAGFPVESHESLDQLDQDLALERDPRSYELLSSTARMAAICVEESRLTDHMGENLHEVLNILATLFNPPGAPHVRLDTVHVPGTLPPAGVSAQLSAFGYREDLKVEVAGYGGGPLSLVLV